MDIGAIWRVVGGFTRRADLQPVPPSRPGARGLLLRSDNVGGLGHSFWARRFVWAVLGWAGLLGGIAACAPPPELRQLTFVTADLPPSRSDQRTWDDDGNPI